ncbi:MAG: 5,10-methylenetetrahydrofolate reductase [Dehalococcoidia bacterium]|nr:5,10-methylenetetrahydrofolate reductase [Dehalococcoidia bacterium]
MCMGSVLVGKLASLLQSNQFLVTAELSPPKGVSLTDVLAKAERLKALVNAFNITDSPGANMSQSGLPMARFMLDKGIEPILQFTGRDRNRIALQGDMLAAAAMGVTNVMCLTGDDPKAGDHPEAKAVFDLDGITLIRAAHALSQGKDLKGNAIKDAPQLFIGAAVNPGAGDLGKEIARMEEKVAAGCAFFQTQIVADMGVFDTFLKKAEHVKTPVLAGVIILKSANMARRMNASVSGVSIPEAMIAEIETAADPGAKGVEIAGRIAKEVRSRCRGVHLMALGWENRIPLVLGQAGITHAG